MIQGYSDLLHGGIQFLFGQVALPDDDDLPTGEHQFIIDPCVPSSILLYLGLPELCIGFSRTNCLQPSCPCQKQPLTKIAVLYLRMTISGLPGTLLTFKRYLYPCDHNHFRTSISSLVALLRICDMQRWRCVGVRTSGMVKRVLIFWDMS